MSDEVVIKVNTRFRVQIPKDIREFLGMKEGDFLVVEREGDSVKFTKLNLKNK